jgi:RNA polymerase sigma factor FliA
MTDALASATPLPGAEDADPAAPALDVHWRALRDHGSSEARETLFSHYMPYAKSIAARCYAARHRDDIDFDDLLQLAHMGLIESLGRFDPAHGVLFTTFCTPRIRGAVLDGIVKLSEAQEQISFDKRRRAERLASLREGLSGERRWQALEDLTAGLALGFMLEGTGMYTPPEGIPGAYSGGYDTAEWHQLGSRLRSALARLTTNERKVISYHYFDALPFEQVATLLGLSRGRISQLHHAALRKLRTTLQAPHSMQITG